MLAQRFSAAFAHIYTTVAKWAKKAKHALPCWRLMTRMTCLCDRDFYLDRKRDAILPILLKMIKDTKKVAPVAIIAVHLALLCAAASSPRKNTSKISAAIAGKRVTIDSRFSILKAPAA